MQTEIATKEANARDRLLRGLPSRDDYYAHRGWVRFSEQMAVQVSNTHRIFVSKNCVIIDNRDDLHTVYIKDLHQDGLAFLVAIGFSLEELSVDEQ